MNVRLLSSDSIPTSSPSSRIFGKATRKKIVIGDIVYIFSGFVVAICLCILGFPKMSDKNSPESKRYSKYKSHVCDSEVHRQAHFEGSIK